MQGSWKVSHLSAFCCSVSPFLKGCWREWLCHPRWVSSGGCSCGFTSGDDYRESESPTSGRYLKVFTSQLGCAPGAENFVSKQPSRTLPAPSARQGTAPRRRVTMGPLRVDPPQAEWHLFARHTCTVPFPQSSRHRLTRTPPAARPPFRSEGSEQAKVYPCIRAAGFEPGPPLFQNHPILYNLAALPGRDGRGRRSQTHRPSPSLAPVRVLPGHEVATRSTRFSFLKRSGADGLSHSTAGGHLKSE